MLVLPGELAPPPSGNPGSSSDDNGHDDNDDDYDNYDDDDDPVWLVDTVYIAQMLNVQFLLQPVLFRLADNAVNPVYVVGHLGVDSRFPWLSTVKTP